MQRPISIEPAQLYDNGALLLIAGISAATLARARRDGQLRFTKQGRRTLYFGEWILDWLNADSRRGATDAK